MGYQLRDYQKKAVSKVFEHWETNKSGLLVQATGTGKTIVFSEVAKQISDNGGRTLILAHRDELLNQAQEKIKLAQDITTGLEKAQIRSNGESIIVGSVQTLKNENRLAEFDSKYFTHIIIDEAHHSTANQYKSVLNHFPNAKILGVTATPYRGDKEDLSIIFDDIVFEYGLIQAIKEGVLSPILFKLIPVEINLNNVHQSMGDFKPKDLESVLDPYLREIAHIMKKECQGRKTVVFLPLISTSQKFTRILRDNGMNAVEINGSTPNRSQILKDFENGKIDILCNSMLLTEGWDCPSLDCIVNLRPTRSETLYTQIIGRGTRKAPNKENLLVLDFLWQSEKYDLCKPSVLVAQNQEQEELIDAYLEEDEEIDITDALDRAKSDIIAQREAKLAEKIERKRHRKTKLIDPIEYGLSIKAEDLINYTPQFMWEKEPPTAKQIQTLKNSDVDISTIPNKGYATKLIDRLITRSNLDLSTPKQIRFLEQKGFKNVGLWQKEEASNLISKIADNNWRVPYYINPRTYNPKEVTI